MHWTNWLLGQLIGHDYRPGRPLQLALILVVVGSTVFAGADRWGLMESVAAPIRTTQPNPPLTGAELVENRHVYQPAQPATNPFVAPVYALENFLPAVDLQQKKNWRPVSRGWGWAIWTFLWTYTLAGWGLTALLVASWTGLLKKD